VASFWEWVADYHCTWFALVPTIITHPVNWTNPYKEGQGEHLRQMRFVRSSSAPLAPSLHRAFEEKFPLLLVEGMGMSEASTVFMNPPSREQRRIGSPGLPCHETKIVDVNGHAVPLGQTGEILLRGPSIMKGYYKNPVATTEVLSPDGWLRTGDLGYRDADGYFFIVGRAKEIVIKGGENIAPREIDETLMQHAAVLEAAAVGVPDAYLGEDLVAYVILKPGDQCSEQELLTHCAQALGEFKTPSRIYFVEDLPKGPSGKVQRLKLREHGTFLTTGSTTVSVPPHSGFIAPRTPVEEKLAEIWRNVLQRTPIGVYDNFFALGGHSLLGAGILARVRDALQVSLPLRVLFAAPTIAALGERIEAARREDDSTPLSPVPSLPLDRAIPLSYAQQRLWFLEQFNPHSATYNTPFAFRLLGPLDLTALQQALHALVARHDSLRTTFSSDDGEPKQIVADHLPLSIDVVDLSSWLEALRETEALRCATAEVQRPFDLVQGPLLRALLVQLGVNDHLLSITWHHIIVDGWSLGVFTRELRVLYEAFSRGRTPVLPALPLQYADFAVWQRQWVQGEDIAKQLAYWKKQLAGVPTLLRLPTDHPRPAQQTYYGSRLAFPISPSLTAALQRLSQQEGATLYMTLLAAFQVLLSRYTGQEDVVVGSPVAGRVRPELEGLIGFFVNTLVLRTDVSNNPTFRAILHRVRDTALDAYAHQDVPFEQLVEELHVPRALGYAPLVQVVFALQNVPHFSIELPGIITERVAITRSTSRFDLSLLVWPDEHGLRSEIEYNTDLFADTTIVRMIEHYQTLLEGIVANPNQPIATLPLLTPSEYQQLVTEWNTTTKAYGHSQCVHQLFEARVERTPHATAVVYEDQQLTYRELNTRANQLAHYLRRLGVGPEALVGLCLERSLELVISILAVLKAGGAYLPLDPRYPRERLQFMLTDARVKVVLTQEHQHPDARDKKELFVTASLRDPQLQVINLGTLQKLPAWGRAEDADNPESGVVADNLAYVIYASGSTGQPKGALITHYNVARLFHSATEVFALHASDTWTLFHSAAFDFSVWEMWGLCLLGENS
jgi:non-ribosomal peptide synthetase component F